NEGWVEEDKMIRVNEAAGGYMHTPIIQNISFNVQKSEFVGIIGPNGSGKTTLAKMMRAIQPHEDGGIVVKDRSISTISAKELAKQMAVLPQQTLETFSYTVKETVSLGRYAHQTGLFGSFTEEDERVVRDVMAQTGVLSYADALLDELSGGERQRVYLAQA